MGRGAARTDPRPGRVAAAPPRPRRHGMVTIVVLAALGAVATCVAALAVAGAAPTTAPAGIPDPGLVVGWGLPLLRLVGLLAGVLTVGSLIVAGFLGPGDVAVAGPRRAARRAASVWAASGVAGYVLTASEVAGVPLASLRWVHLDPGSAPASVPAPLVAALLATAVAIGAGPGAGAASTRTRPRVLLLVGLAAALPVPVVDHLGSPGEGGSTVSAVVVHVVAVLLWVGGLTGIVLHLRSDRAALVTALPGFSRLALGAYVSLVGSGIVVLGSALPFTGAGWEVAWRSAFAGVVVAKVAVLGLLGALGVQQRRRALPRIARGEPRSFVRLAGLELVLMAAGAGLATALVRTPAPPRLPSDHGPGGVDSPSAAGLLLLWRPDALVLVVLGVAVVAYLRGRDRVLASGRAWPRRRTWCFVTGATTAAVALCSSLAVYAPLLLSVHLVQLLVLLLVVPALLLLGHPAALLPSGAGAVGVVPWVAARPATGVLATCGLLLAVQQTPVLLLSLRSPWWHLLVLGAAVACGLLLLTPLLGGAAVPPARRRERAGWLLPVVVCLGTIALRLLTEDGVLAAEWFLELRLGWVDPAADQRRAGVVAAVAAVALSALAGVAALTVRPEPPGGDQGSTSTRPQRSSAPSAP